MKGKSNRITLKELFIRYGIFYFALGGINYILSSSSILNHTEPLILLVTLLFYSSLTAYLLFMFYYMYLAG